MVGDTSRTTRIVVVGATGPGSIVKRIGSANAIGPDVTRSADVQRRTVEELVW
jgi:hypothetical protein